MHLANIRQLFSIVGLLALLLATPIVAQDTETEGEILIDEAIVSSVAVQIRAQADAPPVLEIAGEIYDSCTEVGDITQTVEDDTITIRVITERPAEAFCAQVLAVFEESYTLTLEALQPGDYVVDVNGVTTDLAITDAMLSAAANTPDAPEREPGICAEPTETTQLIEDDVAGICLLVPAEYEVARFDDVPRQIIINSPADDAGQGVSLSITLFTNSTRNIDDITAGLEANATTVDFDWQEIMIGGYDAFISDNEPGQVGHRIAYVQREDLVIVIDLQPIDVLFPDATEAAEAVWDLLLESFTFTADALTEVEAEATASASNSGTVAAAEAVASTACAQATPFEQSFENEHLCFVYPASYSVLEGRNLVILVQDSAQAQEQFVTLAILANETDATSLADLGTALQQAYSRTDLAFAEVTLSEATALQTTAIPSRRGTLQTLVLWDDARYQFILSPIDATLPSDSSAAQALWQTISETLVFKN